MTDAPERIWLDWRPGAAITSGPLTENANYTGYIRADACQERIDDLVSEINIKADFINDTLNQMAQREQEIYEMVPKVKPLEWHLIREEPIVWMGHPADVSSPDYVIRLTADSPDVFAFGLDGEGWIGFCDTLDQAKAAAQSDYAARILSALVLP